MKRERIVFVDYLRAFACFLVMLVHASEGFYPTTIDANGINSLIATEENLFWVCFYDGFMGRISVPLFMIVSAFLLVPLKPGTTMTRFYKHRFKRIVPPLVCFMILYCILPPLWGASTWEQAIQELKMIPFNFPSAAGHLWFMFPLISLYLIMPVISPWLEKATAKEERLFIAFFIVSTFVPWLVRFVSADLWGWCFWNPYFGMLYYCSGYIGYLVLAHYIRVHMTDWATSRRMKIGLLCFIIGGLFTAWSFWIKVEPMKPVDSIALEWAFMFCSPNVLCATFGMFLMFTCIRQTKAPKIVTEISKLSYGMYLMHMFFLSNIGSAIISSDPANPIIPVWAAIPCIAILSYICCFITSKIISLIPGSKWLIG